MKANMSIMKKLKMKNRIFFCLYACAMPVCSLFSATNIDYTSEDSVIFERVQTWKKTHHDNTCADIGELFLGAPYIAKTLDQHSDERLVVNLRQFDCSTFVESVLALWLLPDSASFTNYCNQLTAIRYRNGKCDGYCSRLHYFSDWIADNEAKGFVNNLTQQLGGEPFKCQVNFMSSRPQLYAQLKENSANLAEIVRHEKRINMHKFHFIPIHQLKNAEKNIPTGSIIAITTQIDGLDISHVGFAVRKNGKTFFMHAPAVGKQITITTIPLSEHIALQSKNTGIMVVVPTKNALCKKKRETLTVN